MCRILTAVLAVVVLAACTAEEQAVRWRGLEVALPDGWRVNEHDDTKLSLGNAPFAEEADDELEAAAFFTHEPGTQPADWRELISEQGWQLEADERLTVDGAPATRLVYGFEFRGAATREMVVLIPSRQVVILFQPVIRRGQRDGPEVFARYRPAFEQLLASIDLKAPVG